MTASDLLSVVVGFDDGDQAVTRYMQSGTIRRGRNRTVGDFDTGTATITLHNEDQLLDPEIPDTDPGAWGPVRPGLSLDVFYDDIQLYGGHLKPTGHDYDNRDAPATMLTAQDALAALAQRSFTEWQTTPGQRVGARMAEALARSEVDWPGAVSLDTGVLNLQGDVVREGANVRDYFRLLARSDAGRFFADRENELTYRQVNRGAAASVSASFTDDLTDNTKIPIFGVKVASGDEWYTQVNVTQLGGATATASSDVSIRNRHNGGYLPLNLNGLLFAEPHAGHNMAGYLLGLYEVVVLSIAELRVEMDALSPTDAAVVAALDIDQLVDVTWTPPNADEQITQTLAIEGVDDRWSQSSPWVRALSLSRSIGFLGWAIGSSNIGTGVLGL